jgi:hypothetical protein
MDGLRAEHDKAKAAGDKKRVKELEAEGPAMQDLMHKQGFAVWTVDNILEKIKDKIPEISRQAGGDVVVSKRGVAYKASGVEFVDVTALLGHLLRCNRRAAGLCDEDFSFYRHFEAAQMAFAHEVL